ncbi:Transposable element Tc1 transposase [Anthophora retusa]
MGKRQDIISEKRAYICGLLKSGNLSQRQIAKNVNVSHQTVMRIAKCMKENVPQFSNKRSSCHGKRKTTPRTDRKIIKTALENRYATTRVLVQRLKNDGVDISERTFRRRLYEVNIRCRRPVKKPKLTPKMRKSRLEWAKAHSNLSIADWEKSLVELIERNDNKVLMNICPERT